MGEIEVHEYKKKDVSNAMVIISFPTVGLVSTIVANFLVSNLKLERIAALVSDDFYPAAVIQDGVPTPPVRIFAGDNVCGPDGKCDQLVVITSELPVKTSAFPALADKMIQWCQENDISVVTTLEGMNTPNALVSESPPKVFHVGSNAAALRYLEGLDTEAMLGGMVSGLSGLLLYKGNLKDFSVACLLAEAHAEFPDSRSAAAVLAVLDKMVPQIKMDPEPLFEQAEEIENQIRQAMSQIKPTEPVAELPEAPPSGMYY